MASGYTSEESVVPTMVFFHFDSASVQSGSCKPYHADLLNGITPCEVRSVVIQKMEREPDRSARIRTNDPTEPKDFWEHYDFPDIELTFIFHGANECLGGMSFHRRRHNADPLPLFDEAAQEALFADFSPDLVEVIRCAEAECNRSTNSVIARSTGIGACSPLRSRAR